MFSEYLREVGMVFSKLNRVAANFVLNLSILDVCWGPGYASGQR